MPDMESRTVTLPAEQAAFIDAKVASGLYASTSEVVEAGLRALREQDDDVERWLRDDVLPVYDEMILDPSAGFSVDQVFGEIRARHAGRLKERP